MTSELDAVVGGDTGPVVFGVPSRVPRRRTSFVGRESDVPAVMTLLEEAPAVTLVGVGGVGKTSLAYEVATRIDAEGAATIHIVALQSTVDDDSVARVVADSLGLPVSSAQSPADAVISCLENQGRTLLVLDNCEQVIDGAAQLVDVLLDRCPDLGVLSTSRIVLGVEGEHVWPVDPLRVEGSDPSDLPAVQLLIDRANAAHPRALDDTDLRKLTELAGRLDGVPLALELAAARLSTMGIDELLDQIDHQLLHLESTRRGTEDRHRTLAGVVEWSYRLLDDDSKRAAERLSVFPSTFTRESAGQVMGAADPVMLDKLVNASLVTITERDGGARLLMLEMIRQFLAERLDSAGTTAEAHQAHAQWIVSTVTELTTLIRGSDARMHRRRLAAELDNIRVALAWAAAEGDVDTVVQLIRGLHDHVVGSAGREVHAWIEQALEQIWDRAEALDALLVGAEAAMTRGNIPRYREIMEQADRLHERYPDARVVPGPGHLSIGRELEWIALHVFEGNVDHAVVVAERIRDSVPEDPWAASWSLMRLSMPFAYAEGRDEEAAELAERAVEMAELSQNTLAMCWSHFALGEALRSIDPDRAIASYRHAYGVADTNGFTFLEGLSLVAWASALGRHGEPVEALERFAAAIQWWDELGGWSFLSTTLRNFGEFLANIERPEEAVLIRCAIEEISRSSRPGGEDANTDQYLRRRLLTQLGKARFEELQHESHTLDEARVVGLALETIEAELAARGQSGVGPAGEAEDADQRDEGAGIAEAPDGGPSVTRFQVIAFTDLESSTSYMAGRRDSDTREEMREYDLRANATLAEHRGERVKSTGDGVLATFPTISDALDWAVEFQRSIDAAVEGRELPLRVKIGLHAGETVADMGDVYGTAVNLAARVVAEAGGGEVLVTDAVRQIAVGGHHSFESLGEKELKGLPEPIGLHLLMWK